MVEAKASVQPVSTADRNTANSARIMQPVQISEKAVSFMTVENFI